MDRNFNNVASVPFCTDKVEAALATIRQAIGVFRVPGKPPTPPPCLTAADRLVVEHG
jgi:hypothetical protein